MFLSKLMHLVCVLLFVKFWCVCVCFVGLCVLLSMALFMNVCLFGLVVCV